MNATVDVEDFSQLHEPHWVLREAFQLLVFGLVIAEAALAVTVQRGWIWLAMPLVLVTSHLMHGALIGLHEAAQAKKSRVRQVFDWKRVGIQKVGAGSRRQVDLQAIAVTHDLGSRGLEAVG